MVGFLNDINVGLNYFIYIFTQIIKNVFSYTVFYPFALIVGFVVFALVLNIFKYFRRGF